jgi:hypothetical protein
MNILLISLLVCNICYGFQFHHSQSFVSYNNPIRRVGDIKKERAKLWLRVPTQKSQSHTQSHAQSQLGQLSHSFSHQSCRKYSTQLQLSKDTTIKDNEEGGKKRNPIPKIINTFNNIFTNIQGEKSGCGCASECV